MRRSTCLAVLLGAAAAAASSKKKQKKKPVNVLWLLVDDLRPQLGAYGQRETQTPRLDALAREGVVFERAYCQLSVCAPSRNSFMTGRRPDSLRVYNFVDHFRSTTPDAIALPEFFRSKGYVTLGAGKTYQPGKPPLYDEGRSWSGEMPYLHLRKNLTRCAERHPSSNKFLDVCPTEGSDQDFMDRRTADYSIEAMSIARGRKKPFFVACGLYRPHLRWHVPRRFYDLYGTSNIRAPMKTRQVPVDMPDVAWANEGCHTMTTREHGTKKVMINRPLPGAMQRDLVRGYMACVSWVDHLSGEVLDALDGSGGKEDTIVLLSSDHGFHLGEQASWTKHTLFEHSARVPFVIRAPGIKPGRTRAPVELIDIYRTLADLAHLSKVPEDVQGSSLVPVLRDTHSQVRNFSLTQYPRCPRDWSKMWDANCKRLSAKDIPVMGYSLRVPGWRFTEWYRWERDPRAPIFEGGPPRGRVSTPIATELYALPETAEDDFDAFERRNVAAHADAACALRGLRAALLELLACQHGASARDRAACDAGVTRRVNAAAPCVGERARAALMRARDGVSSARG